MTQSTSRNAAAPLISLESAPASRRGAQRPRIRYSRALAEKICRRLAKGEAIATIARDPAMPPRSTLRYWLKKDKDGLFAPCPRTPGKGAPPTLYTKRIAREIFRRLAQGRSLASIARDPGMPAAPTVIDWVHKDLDGFAAAYARARELGRDTLADEIIELADDRSQDWEQVRGKRRRFNRENLARAKLRIAARRFLWANTRPTYERGSLTVEIVRFSGDAGNDNIVIPGERQVARPGIQNHGR